MSNGPEDGMEVHPMRREGTGAAAEGVNSTTAPSKPSVLPKIILAVLAFALLTVLGVYVPYTKAGRSLLGICVVRIVNESGVPVKNIRFVFSRHGQAIADHEEIDELTDRHSRQLWFHTGQLMAQELTFNIAGEGRQHTQWWTIYPGSILIIRIEEGGLSRIDETD